MIKVGVVACCGAKLDHAAPARELYRSALFLKSRAYVEKHCDEWVILSAKHGVVHPDEVLEPYDLRLSQVDRRDRLKWARQCRDVLREMYPNSVYIVLGGAEYRRVFISNTIWYFDHDAPFDGMGIARQLAWLTRHEDKA